MGRRSERGRVRAWRQRTLVACSPAGARRTRGPTVPPARLIPDYASLHPGYEPSKIHLQNIEAAAETVDRVDDLAFVDEAVIELDRADRRTRGARRLEGRDLLGLVRIGDVVGALAAVEERADDDVFGVPCIGRRRILVDVVSPEPPAAALVGIDRRH